MEFPDLKIDAIAEFLLRYIRRGGEVVDGINHVDIQAYFIIIGIFMISWSFRNHGKKVDVGNIRAADLDRTVDENTDSQIEVRREMRLLNQKIDRLTDEINKKL